MSDFFLSFQLMLSQYRLPLLPGRSHPFLLRNRISTFFCASVRSLDPNLMYCPEPRPPMRCLNFLSRSFGKCNLKCPIKKNFFAFRLLILRSKFIANYEYLFSAHQTRIAASHILIDPRTAHHQSRG